MKKFLFFITMLILATGVSATTRYGVNSNNSITSSVTACEGSTPGTITYTYNTCTTTGSANTMTVTWYTNTSNVATTSGAGVTVVSTATGVAVATASTGTQTKVPSSTTPGTLYYYCALSNCTGSCGIGTSGVLISATCTVTINGPSAISAGATNICSGSSSTYSDATSGGTWSTTAGTIASISSTSGSSITVTGVSAGSATISYTVSGCAATQAVTISAAPGAISGASSMCAPFSTTLLSESWESGTPTTAGTAVDGWNYIGSTSGYWTGVTAGVDPTVSPEAGTHCAEFLSFTYSGVTAALVSPSFSMTSYSPSSVTLTFWVYRDKNTSYTGSGYASEAISIYINTSAAVGGTLLGVVPRDYASAISGSYISGTSTVSSSQWVQYTCTIPSSYTGSTNYILFSAYSDFGDNQDLDNIVLASNSNIVLTDGTAGGTWSSSATGVATVSATGTVYPVSAGSVTISYTTCASVTKSETVIGLPAAIGGTLSACPGTTTTLTNATTGGTWTSGTTSVATVNSSTGVVYGVSAGTTVITYSTGCGNNATATVTINPTPTISGGASSVCVHGTTTAFTGSPSSGTWTSSATGTATIGSSTGVAGGVTAGSVTITYTKSACIATQSLTVNGLPTVTASPASAIYCSAGSPDALTGSGASTYTWAPAATLSSSAGTTVNATPTGNTTYTVTGTNSLGCIGTGTVSLTYNYSTTPIVPYGSDTVICMPGLAPMIEYGTGGTWSSSNTSVFTVDGSGIVYAAGAGTANVVYTNATCGTASQALTVITGGFSMSTTPSAGTYCSTGSPLSIAVTSGSADTFLWEPTYGLSDSVHSTTTASPAVSIVYTVYGTNSSTGCHSSTTVTVINNTPAAITGGVTLLCVSGGTTSTTWTDATSGGSWSTSDATIASVSSGGVVTAVGSGTATITYNISGCYVTRNVNVATSPGSISGTTSVCSTSPVTLTDAAAYGTWSSTTTTVATIGSSSGIVYPVAFGTTTISYSTGCGTAATTTFSNNTVAPITGTTGVCAPILNTLVSGDFESGCPTAAGSPVGGWSYIGATSGYWFGVPSGGSASYPSATPEHGSGMAEFESFYLASGSATLCSSSFSLSGISGTTITFWVYRDYGSSYTGSGYAAEAITCYMNTTNSLTGATSLGVVPRDAQTAISGSYISGTSTTTSSQWVQYTCTVPAAFTGATNYLLFKGNALDGDDQYLDNVLVQGYTSYSTTLADAATGGTWASSNTSVATVAAGVVHGVAIGSTTISYTTGCGTVTQGVNVLGIPGTITGPTTVVNGGTTTLTDATANGVWTSSATGVATATAATSTTGTIGGASVGSATITYSTGCGTAATYGITVTAPCSGTPTAGTAAISPTFGGSTTAFTLSLTGYTVSAGIGFQWQSSPDGSTWTNITGATNTTYSFTGISANKYFQCIVSCSYSSSSVTTASIEATYFPASSCTPAFSDGNDDGYFALCNATTPLKVIGASSSTLTDAYSIGTSCFSASCMYTDQTSTSGMTSLVLNAGTTYTFTVGNSYGSEPNMNYQVWIDFNNNGTFETSESVGGIASTSLYAPTFAVVIPPGSSSIVAGNYRMRAEAEYYYHTYPSLNPCPSGTGYYYGEVRDYKVSIATPPTFTLTPTSIPFPPTTTGTSSTTITASFSGGYLVPSSGNFTVTAPSGFQVWNGSAWATTYAIAYSGSTLSSTTISIQFDPSSSTTYSGNVAITGGGISGANIAVTGTGAAACSGTPTAGTASTSVTSANSSTAITLTCTGYSASGGIGFQWQSSPDNSTWSNISGATLASYSFTGISAITYYQCIVTCPYSSLSAITGSVEIYYFPSSSCSPKFEYGNDGGYMEMASATYPVHIVGASSTSITDATVVSCSSACGYTDQTTTSGMTSLILNAGTTYVFTVGNLNGETNMNYQVWIDFNSNGTFESSESVGGIATTSAYAPSFNVVMPAGSSTITPGVYRMRIVEEFDYHTYPSLSPCPPGTPTYYYGEIRDYKITLAVPPTFTLSPTTIPFSPTTTGTTSATSTATFSGLYLTPSSGNFTVTAPTGFNVWNGSAWVTSFTIAYSGSALSATSIQIQFAPTSATTYSGNVTITGGGISGANIAVTGTGAAACSGTPTAGTASTSVSSANSSTAITLTCTGYTAAGGIVFQWQSSPDNATWSNISGATLSSYGFTGISANTYYKCIVTCSYSSSSATTGSVEIYYFPASSCTPVFAYGNDAGYMSLVTSTNHFLVNGASSTSINDANLISCSSSCSYLDLTTTSGLTSLILNAGSSYTFSTGNPGSYVLYDEVWIDFNSNGIFETSEVVGGENLGSAAAVHTYTVTIPSGSSTITPGVYRMRVETQYNEGYFSYPSLPSCPNGVTNESYYGEARDYKITLNVPPVFTLSPTTIPFSPTTTGTTSATSTATFSGAYLTPSSGNFTVTAPTGFNVWNGSAWVTSYTIAYSSSTLGSTTISVQFAPTSATTYSGNVTITGGGISGANIAVTGTGAAACSGTPTAGSTSVSPTSGNSSTAFTLTCTGFTSAGGIGFQWQSSPDNATWTNITGATLSTYSFTGISANTYYQCVVSCSYSSSSASSTSTEAYFFHTSTCTPAFEYGNDAGYFPLCNSTDPFKVVGASSTSLTDAVTVTCSGTSCMYTDQTTTSGMTSLILSAGTTYTFTTGNYDGEPDMNYQVWIDFNNNGTFESSESVGGIASTSAVAPTFSVVIPSGSSSITPGVYRMRAEAEYDYHTYPGLNPCPPGTPTYYYGEVRDYKITLIVPPTFTLSPTSIPFSPTTTGSTSATSTATFSASYLTPSSGNFTVTAPTGFNVWNGSAWVTSYTIAYSGSALGSTSILIQFAPTSATTYSGNVTITGGGISGANIAVTGTGAAACSGTPTAGTASISPTSGNSSSSFTLTCTGYSATGGIGFQWQSSPDGSTWTNITGATLSAYTFTGISTNMYYHCVVTCSYSSASATTATIEAYYFPSSSCTPVFYYGDDGGYFPMCSSTYPLIVHGASSTTLTDATTNSSSSSAGCYIDQTTTSGMTSLTLAAGSSYTFTVGNTDDEDYMSYQVWIDFNDNGTFESSESVGGVNMGGTAAYAPTFSVTLPAGTTAGVVPGVYRMRVEGEYDYHTYPSLSPCPTGLTGSYYYGDVRDYKITLTVPPGFTLSPTSIAFSPTVSGSSSATSTATFAGFFLSPASGNFTVTAPSGFQVWNGSAWVTSYTIAYTSATLGATTISVQFDPTSVTTFSGNVTITGGGTSGASIAVTGTGVASPCSGTPTAGTGAVSPTSGNTSTAFTLTCTGFTSAGSIGFQWQSSADGSTWSNITGATLSSYSFTGISANTYYHCIVSCSVSGLSATTAATEAFYFPSSSCTPQWYYSTSSGIGATVASSTAAARHFIVSGYSGSINDANNDATSNAYMDQTTSGLTCTLAAGASYTFTAGSATNSYAFGDQAWIDFNADGIFQTTESIGGQTGASTYARHYTVTIPNGSVITPGVFRMRVACEYTAYATYPNIPPCPYEPSDGESFYGETRDYKITIYDPPCSGTPTAGTATASLTSGCAPYSSALSLTGTTSASALTFQWQSSPDNTTWTNISGATTIPYSVSQTAVTTYYRCIVTCSISSSSSTSSVVTLNATPTIAGAYNVCQSATTTLTDAQSGGTWSSSATGTATVSSGGVVSGVAAGAVTISYAETGCTQTFGMNVIGTPASITGATSVCNTFSTTLSDATTGGTWSSSAPSTATVDPAAGTVTGLSVGSVTITYSTGCGTNATYTFNVNTQPSIIVGPASICTLYSGTLTDTISGGTWSVSSTTIGTIDATTGTFYTNSTVGTTTVSYTIGSCYVTSLESSGSSAPGSVTGTTSACVGATSTLSDATAGGLWSSTNTAIASVNATSGVVTAISNGTATISYNNGCGVSTASWTSNGTLVTMGYSSGSLSSPNAVCSGGTLNLTSGATSGGTYSWSGPNSFSSASANPSISSVTTAASGVYTFTATVSGCTSPSYYMFVPVDAIPSVTVTSSPTSICPGGTVTLSDVVSAPATGSYIVDAIPYNLLTLSSPSAGPSGDDISSAVTLPFSFNFYGTSYSTLNICTNGFMSFTSTLTTFADYAYPSTSAVPAAIAFSETDLNTGSGGSITYQTLGSAPNRKFVVSFNSVAAYGGVGTVTGEVILYETSNIIDLMINQCNVVPSDATGFTFGIQNASGTVASVVPGYNNNSTSFITTPQGWRFEQPAYSYSWSPATDLSSTTVSGPTSTGLSSTQVYTVTSTDTRSGCTAGNVTPVTVTVNPLPTAYSVTGGGAYCSTPGTGVAIGLSGSDAGIHYQLYKGASTVGSYVTGTGSAFNFGTSFTDTSGVYTVVATNVSTGCTQNMTGSTTISVNANPTAYTVTGGNGCTSTGITIGLSNSQSSVSYQLYNTGTGGATMSGTGSSISYGAYTTAGTYTIVGTGTGGCTTTMTGSSVIYTSPTAYTVTGGNGCTTPGVDIGLFGSQSGFSYQLYNGASVSGGAMTGTGSALDFTTITTPGVYTIVATGTGSCTTTMSGADTIVSTPSVTLGANPSVCQPTTSATISYSGATGSPTTYSITWDATALSAGFSNIGSATLSGGIISLVVPSGVAGTFNGTISVYSGSCGSSSHSFTVTSLAYPTASITSAAAPCVGNTTNIIFGGTSGDNFTYSVDGGAPVTATLTGGTYSITTSAITTTHTYELLTVYNSVCTTVIDSTDTLAPIPMQWVGGTSGMETDWNTASNWSCGFVPTASYDVTIPSGTTYMPTIAASASGTTRNMTLASGAVVTVKPGAVLNVKGSLANNGYVTGDGTLSMNGTSAQSISGTGLVDNFDLNNSTGATIVTANLLTVNNTLSVTSGNLVTNDSLVLAADSTTTARVAPLPATGSNIVGNVRVMQYVFGGRRAYRFWAHPFSAFIPLSQIENYIDITGAYGGVNGFTPTGTNNASCFRYNPLYANSANPADPGWIAFTSCYATPDSNKFKQYQGIRLFFRGAKGEGLGLPPYTVISPVTVGMWGPLNQGSQTITLHKGSGLNQDYNMVGNPYPSCVDIGTVVYNAKAAGNIAGTAFYVFNPYLGTAGQFLTIPIGSGAPSPYYLQSENSFQVRAMTDGVVLNFAETNKSATSTYDLLKALPEYVSLTLYDGSYHAYDMTYVKFNDAATTAEDNNYDAGKPGNGATDVTFYSLSSDNHKLSIDGRPFKAESVIPLGVHSDYAQEYIIKAEGIAVPAGGQLYLHDKLLKQYVLLQAGTEYRFTVTTDKNTQGENRFELSMSPTDVAALQASQGLQVLMTPNPATDEVKVNFTNGKKEDVNVRVLDLSGVSVYNVKLGMQQNGTVSIPLSNFASGIYMVELTSGDQKVVQRLIKE